MNGTKLKWIILFTKTFLEKHSKLSEWGAWSECDAKCGGTGIRSRSRKVLQKPENGGKHCASLLQKQGCEGFKCKSFHERKTLSGECSIFSVPIEIPISDTCCSLTKFNSSFFSYHQKQLCYCHQSSRKVVVKTIHQTSDGTWNYATQTCTGTIETTSEFFALNSIRAVTFSVYCVHWNLSSLVVPRITAKSNCAAFTEKQIWPL